MLEQTYEHFPRARAGQGAWIFLLFKFKVMSVLAIKAVLSEAWDWYRVFYHQCAFGTVKHRDLLVRKQVGTELAQQPALMPQAVETASCNSRVVKDLGHIWCLN